jgi:hypothetical protein
MKTRTYNRSTRLLAPLAVAALSLGVSACSDDDGDPDDLDNPVDGVDDNLDDTDVDVDVDVDTTDAP